MAIRSIHTFSGKSMPLMHADTRHPACQTKCSQCNVLSAGKNWERCSAAVHSVASMFQPGCLLECVLQCLCCPEMLLCSFVFTNPGDQRCTLPTQCSSNQHLNGFSAALCSTVNSSTGDIYLCIAIQWCQSAPESLLSSLALGCQRVQQGLMLRVQFVLLL